MLCWENGTLAMAKGQDDDIDVSGADVSGPREPTFIAAYRRELVSYPSLLNMHGEVCIRGCCGLRWVAVGCGEVWWVVVEGV